MWPELLFLLPLAVLTNTVFPVPFEPIFIYFAASRDPSTCVILAAMSALCAGAGAVLDFHIAGLVSRRISCVTSFRIYSGGLKFYLLAVSCAFLPVPFSLVRAALIQVKPKMFGYALAVMAGRFPRYVAIAMIPWVL